MIVIEKIVGIVLTLLGVSWWGACFLTFKRGTSPQQGTVIHTFIITMTGVCLLLGGKIWILGIALPYYLGVFLLVPLSLVLGSMGMARFKIFHLISYIYVATYAIILSLVLSQNYGWGIWSSVVIGIGVTIGQRILVSIIAFVATRGNSTMSSPVNKYLILLLSVLNLIFPGSALFWRRQIVQGICYIFSFGILNVFAPDIGLMWAFYILVMAQIHFHKKRKIEATKPLGKTGKTIIWGITILMLILYIILYGPSWTHDGEIKHPMAFFLLVIVSLLLPALLLTFWLTPKNMSILSKLFGSRNIENQKNKKFQELEGKNSISETLELGMVLIPAGEFEMGTSNAEKQALINLALWNNWCDNELPEHTVYLDAFYLDKYEVTNAQYAIFLNAYGKNVDAAGHEWLDIDDSLIEKVGGAYQPKAGYGNHPVVAVSWYGAAAYAQFYAQRLPTEAEWEKAARGGLVGKRYPWGDDITHDDANYSGTGDGTSPVGSFPPNGYGLYDVAGNVWEWCADEYDDEYYSQSQKKNPKGPGVAVTFQKHDFTNVISMRVLRGGALTYPYFLRCSYRGRFNADNSSADVGFRCARDL